MIARLLCAVFGGHRRRTATVRWEQAQADVDRAVAAGGGLVQIPPGVFFSLPRGYRFDYGFETPSDPEGADLRRPDDPPAPTAGDDMPVWAACAAVAVLGVVLFWWLA